MRAVVVKTFGGPEVLGVVEVPERSSGLGRPLVLPGLKAAGTVTALDEGANGFRVGQEVLAMGAVGAPDFYAERAAVSLERAHRPHRAGPRPR